MAEASWWLFGGSAALQRSPVPHLETLLWAALEMWLVQLGRRAADHLLGTTGNTLVRMGLRAAQAAQDNGGDSTAMTTAAAAAIATGLRRGQAAAPG